LAGAKEYFRTATETATEACPLHGRLMRTIFLFECAVLTSNGAGVKRSHAPRLAHSISRLHLSFDETKRPAGADLQGRRWPDGNLDECIELPGKQIK